MSERRPSPMQARLLDLIRYTGSTGATVAEICDVTGRSRDSIIALRQKLERKGLIRDTGRVRDRSTIWVAVNR